MSDRIARVLTGLAVLTVAVIAAVVSFTHIETLALAHGQPLTAARLLPLSVDGLVLASSLTLLTEARAQRPAPRVARVGLVLGIAATVAANIAFGARYGLTGAAISAWPGVSFVLAAETLVGQMRRTGGIPTPVGIPGTVAGDVPGPVAGDVSAGVPVNATVDAPAGTVSPAPDVTVRAVADDVLPGVPGETPVTRVRMPQDGPDTVPHVPRTAPVRRSPKRAPKRKAQPPERVFATELAAGQVPSLRSVKERMHVGTDRARVIRDQLGEVMQEKAA